MPRWLSILALTLFVAFSARGRGPFEPRVTARAAVLLEARTGQILWARNPHLRLPPASTTKIMTALLAAENLPLARRVKASGRACATDGSSIWLEEGEERTIEELLYGALLNSGNDACVVLAEAVAGSEERFAGWMTARARNLGAKNTTFVNANGLPARGHRSTAYDLALIAREALNNPVIAAIARTKVKNIPWPGKEWDRRLINHNKLLWRYKGADGVKTGYTSESGHCLVASASRDGRRLIAVVLDSKRMYDEASSMLDYGFEHFRLIEADRNLSRIVRVVGGSERALALQAGGDLAYTVPAREAPQVRVEVRAPKSLRAPVNKGRSYGWAALYSGNELLCRTPLIAASDINARGLFWSLAAWVMRLLGVSTPASPGRTAPYG